MPSYTSSSDSTEIPEIHVPEQPWGRIAFVVLLVAVMAAGAWELRVRGVGYGPSYDDTPMLWSMSRDAMQKMDRPVVIVGDSRIRFDLDHEMTSKAFGGRPVVSLAMNGSVARPVLTMLAKDPSFRGTAIVSYTPGLFWAPGGPNFDLTNEWLQKHDKRTVAAKWSQWLYLLPDSTLAFLEKEDLSLVKLLRRAVPLANRAGFKAPPQMPPYLCSVLLDRRELMWDKLEKDTGFQAQVQQIWKGLFSLGRPLPPELLTKLRSDVVADVKAIQARGGEVIFVACPSSGWLRDFEEQGTPKATHWDPLIQESGCIGVHYMDHDAMRSLVCPEWSHLTRADAVKFTEMFVKVLSERRVEK